MNTIRRLPSMFLISSLISMTTSCSRDEVGLDVREVEGQLASTMPTTAWSELPAEEVDEVDDTSEDVEHTVRRAFDELMQRRVACGRDPNACDISSLAVEGRALHLQLSNVMKTRIESGIIASDVGGVRYRVESIDVLSPDQAVVTTCLHDDTVLVIDEATYDDTIYSARSTWTLMRVDGRWLWSEESVQQWAMEEDLCGDL